MGFADELEKDFDSYVNGEVKLRETDAEDLSKITLKMQEDLEAEIKQEKAEAQEGNEVLQNKILETFEILEEDIMSHKTNRANYDEVIV